MVLADWRLPVIAILVFWSGGAAQADIYKCTAPDGSISYSQLPCPKQQTETVSTGSRASGPTDCSHANKFAFASARLMQGGLTSTQLFNRYGGIDALSNGSINIVNYVYGFRTNDRVTAERIAALTTAKCQARSLGDVSCDALPLGYTEGIGGCDAPPADAAVSAAPPAGPGQAPIAPAAGASTAVPDLDVVSASQREACKDRYRDQIDAIDAQMRRGYSSEQGEVYRERLRALTQGMRRC